MTSETNYYQVIYDLKKYQNTLSKIKEQEDLDMFLAEIKAYIFSIKELKEIFISKIKEYDRAKTVLEEKIKTLYQEIQKCNTNLTYTPLNRDIVNVFQGDTQYFDTSNTFDYPLLFYFPSFKLSKNDKVYRSELCINAFYIQIENKEFIRKISKLISKMGNSLDFAILSQNIIPTVPTIDFYISYVTTALYSVLNILETRTQKLTMHNLYNYTDEQIKKELYLNNLKKLSQAELRVYNKLLENHTYTNDNIAKALVIGKTTVKFHIENICAKFDLNKTNKTALVQYISENI